MPTLIDLMAFNVQEAAVSLWVCRGPRGAAAAAPSYTAKWVEVAEDLEAVLKEAVSNQRQAIEDVQPFGLLVTAEATGSLEIATDETHAALLTGLIGAQTDQRRVNDVADLFNSKFYVIKLVHDGQVVYAVRKTGGIWKTKNNWSVKTVVFREQELTVDTTPRFDISDFVDFFIVGDGILIKDKGSFETILKYKQAHREDFHELQQEQEFVAVFAEMAPLVAHVGDNKIQLRRASAIRQKGHYKDEEFMARLRERSTEFGFTIEFDTDGRISPTAATCSQIMTALLDHRLASAFSSRIYDVPSTTVVNI